MSQLFAIFLEDGDRQLAALEAALASGTP